MAASLLYFCQWTLKKCSWGNKIVIQKSWSFRTVFDLHLLFVFQEQARESKGPALSPDDGGEEVESPMPSNVQNPVKRRGAISAEPITEEDVATYVKKVNKKQLRKN